MRMFSIPWKAWYGDGEFKLTFPSEWEVEFFSMHDAPSIGKEEIAKALFSPIGSKPLSIIAKGKKRAVIVVDDISRPTSAYRILPLIMDELRRAGIKEKNIRIITSLGAHRPMLREDLIKKLGENIWNSIEIHNHNPFENLVNLGTSTRGTPICINKLFMDADVKIGVGCILPHTYAGFGGGGKIILPGISGIKTLEANHQPAIRGLKGGLGLVDGNEVRQDIEEIALKTGLNFIINVVVNSRREIAGVFAGDVIKAHRKGVEFARIVYNTEVSCDFDVGVFNAYPKDTDLIQAANALNIYLSTKGKMINKEGVIIIATASPEGGGYHSLEGPGMRLFEYVDRVFYIQRAVKNKAVYIFSPYLTPQEVYKYYSSAVLFFNEWQKLIENLRQRFTHRCKVGIFPCASVQLASC